MIIEVKTSRGLLLEAVGTGSYDRIDHLKQDIIEAGLPSVGKEDFYLEHNGRVLRGADQLAGLSASASSGGETWKVVVVPRIKGGKGGFGSMLRAIGAQIEKTTNRDACRDLSGRRLRDLNEEQRLKKWYARQKERAAEKEARKKEKLGKLRHVAEGPALPKIADQGFLQKREDIEERVFESVDQGTVEAEDVVSSSTGGSGQGTSSGAGTSQQRALKNALRFDDELDSEESEDESSSDDDSSVDEDDANVNKEEEGQEEEEKKQVEEHVEEGEGDEEDDDDDDEDDEDEDEEDEEDNDEEEGGEDNEAERPAKRAKLSS